MKMSGRDIQNLITETITTINNIKLLQNIDINEKARIADQAKLPISFNSFLDALQGHELVLRTILQKSIDTAEIDV